MILELFYNYFVGWKKYLIYLLFFFLIYFFNKFDLDIIWLNLKSLIVITLLIIFIIIVLTKLNNIIVVINKFIFKYLLFIIKIRREFNFAFMLRVILSLFIFIDLFLIKILFLHTRNRTVFYFFRLIVYYNILILFTFPIFLIIELYTTVLFFFEKPIELYTYISKRIDFFLITICIVLLLEIKWINVIIFIWILDQLVLTYYHWIKSFFNIKVDSITNWRQSCIALRLAFNNCGMSYNTLARNLKQMNEYRYKVIFLFRGLVYDNNGKINKEFADARFKIMFDIYGAYTYYFWNNYYIKYQKMKNAAWEYYDSHNDEEFILRYLNNYIIGFGMNKESFKKYFYNTNIVKILIENELSDKFYKKIYILIYNVLVIFKDNEILFNDFFVLREKFDLRLHYDYMNKIEVKEFFNKFKI
jgi:hypothetical protein